MLHYGIQLLWMLSLKECGTTISTSFTAGQFIGTNHQSYRSKTVQFHGCKDSFNRQHNNREPSLPPCTRYPTCNLQALLFSNRGKASQIITYQTSELNWNIELRQEWCVSLYYNSFRKVFSHLDFTVLHPHRINSCSLWSLLLAVIWPTTCRGDSPFAPYPCSHWQCKSRTPLTIPSLPRTRRSTFPLFHSPRFWHPQRPARPLQHLGNRCHLSWCSDLPLGCGRILSSISAIRAAFSAPVLCAAWPLRLRVRLHVVRALAPHDHIGCQHLLLPCLTFNKRQGAIVEMS